MPRPHPRPRGQTTPVLPSRGIAMNHLIETGFRAGPWNKGKLVGQKAPLRLKDIWAIRIRLQLGSRIRELALFNLAIDCKLRSCDLVRLRVRDLLHGERIAARAIVMQQKTQRPVQFEITEQTRESLGAWIRQRGLRGDDGLRNTQAAAHQGLPYLPTNKESSGRPALARAQQAGKHSEVLGHRSR